MTLGERLKSLRLEIGISQEAIGAQGFVSTPFWIKLERGLRSPSDEMIMRLVSWLLREKYFTVNAANELMEELLTLKYLCSPSLFVRKLAQRHAKQLPSHTSILVAEEPGVYHVTRRERSDRSR